MAIWDFLKGELIEIIEWQDDSRDTLSWRFPDEDKAIKNGAALIVRESQFAQFVYLGEFGDTFGPGKHTLTTDNIPILTRLKSWKFGLESPFKADLYFVNSRLFTGNKWGTSNPVMMRDKDFGIVRVRAFGTYDFRVTDLKLFLREVAGSDHNFRLDEFSYTMRSRVVSVFSDALATASVPVLDAATRFTELGDALLSLINPMMSTKYGIEIASFIVENVSVPPEVEEAMDKRASMTAVGNLNDYVKYQMAQGMESGEGGAGGLATEMAVGLAIAQQMMQRGGGILGSQPTTPGGAGVRAAAGAPFGASESAIPELLDLDQVAGALRVSTDDVLSIIESGELPAKKIGSSHRIKRSALESYLADQSACRALMDTVHGLYIPYWTFDANVYCPWSADAGYYYYVTMNKRRVRRVRWEHVNGVIEHFFDDHPVPATRGIEIDLLRRVEPFPTHHLVPYDTAYLSGFVVEHYQIVLIEAVKLARESMRVNLKRMAAGAIHADTHRNLTIRPSYSSETFKHVLVPVWLLSYDYGSRKFQVVVNGYTGRMAGKYPKSWWKILGLVATLALIAAFLVGLDALQF